MNWLRRERGDFMCTYSGVKYYPAQPRIEDIRILDIAHHLSRLCRFTGAIHAEHYSVSEHSVHVSYLVPRSWALAGLLHDAAEAYLADLNRPTKHNCPDYQRLEALTWALIAEKYWLPLELPPCVKAADNAILYAERLALMPQSKPEDGDGWPVPELDVSHVKILALAPDKAKQLFLNRFHELLPGARLKPDEPLTPRPLFSVDYAAEGA